MKVDFNEQGMMIQFDKVPRLLFFNDEPTGSGKLFLNGVQRKGLIDVKIHAHTKDESKSPWMECEIKYFDKNIGIVETIEKEPENT